jgi:hypothetical protein
MRAFLIRALLAVTLGFTHPGLAQAAEDMCKNHYILRQVCVPCPADVSLSAPIVLLEAGNTTLAVGSDVWHGAGGRELSSLAVTRMDPSDGGSKGSPDPTWGDCGIARIPIWGESDRARAIALQPDGKVLVLGTALDPTENLIRDWDYLLEPHSYLAVIRLDRDGTLDRTFATRGRLVFRLGVVQHSVEHDVNSWTNRIEVLAEGRIRVSLKYDRDNYSIPVAQILPDGTIEAVYASAPLQVGGAVEFHAVIEFTNGRGDLYLSSDPDEAITLDRGGIWYRTGRAFAAQ